MRPDGHAALRCQDHDARMSQRALTLRTTLLGLVLGSATLIAVLSAAMAYRFAKGAEMLRDPSDAALAAGRTIESLDSTLGPWIDSMQTLLITAETGAGPMPATLEGTIRILRGMGDSAWVMRGVRSLYRSGRAVHGSLARAVSGENQTVGWLLESARAVQQGRMEPAATALRRADSTLRTTRAFLEEIHTASMLETFEREQALMRTGRVALRVAVASVLFGTMLVAGLIVVFHRRVHRPLAELDRALARASAGDLSAAVPVRHRDEIGRVGAHFNEMTAILRARSEEEERRAHNLTERLGRLLEESSNEIYVFDAETLRFLQVNDGARRNLGFTAEALATRTPVDLLPDYDEPRFAALLRPLREGAVERVTIATRHRRADGSFYPVEVGFQLSRQEEPPVFVAVAEDITERARLEAERDRIFDLSVDLLTVSDLSGRLLRVNRASERILDRRPADLEGRSFFELVHPDDRSRVEAELARLADGATVREFTIRVQRRDGAYRWISWNCDPPAEGLLYGVGRDVTERRETEARQAELRAAVERAAHEWTVTFDALEDPIVLVNGEERVVRLNAAAGRLAAGTPDRVVGRPLRELAGDAFWRRIAELVRDVRETGRSTSSQVAGGPRAGTWDVEAMPVEGLGADGGAVIVIAHDVSAVVRLQHSLRHHETMAAMGSLLVGVAHEVRNPLFGMTAALDALEARRPDATVGDRHLQMLRDQVGRLTQLMQELLDYGKPRTLELEAVSLGEIIAQAIEATGPVAEERGVRVTMPDGESLPPVQGDRLRLVQVYSNLMLNAIQHSPSGTAVGVRAHVMQQDGRDWVESVVVDGGPGFAPDDLPHLFEPFFTRRLGGTGLGLALVHRIVQQHGGRVTAANLPDRGAAVHVRLPVAGA